MVCAKGATTTEIKPLITTCKLAMSLYFRCMFCPEHVRVTPQLHANIEPMIYLYMVYSAVQVAYNFVQTLKRL